MGDSQAALLAHGCFAPGAAKVTFGTGSSVLLNIGAEPRRSERGVLTAARERTGLGDFGPEDFLPRLRLLLEEWGGDGLMLQTLHRFMKTGKPIYGMHRGTVGFLMNEYSEDDLLGRINAAERAVIHPLAMVAIDSRRQQHRALAINEVSLLRAGPQAAKLRISVDGKVRLERYGLVA